MLEDFKPPNNEQRKYVAGLAAIACVGWASPIYTLFTALHLHIIKFSLEYILFLLFSVCSFVFFFVIGFSILRAIKND